MTSMPAIEDAEASCATTFPFNTWDDTVTAGATLEDSLTARRSILVAAATASPPASAGTTWKSTTLLLLRAACLSAQ
jgi:hypothetical protein